MPMILGIVFALLYTLFVLHDRVVLQANINELLQQEEAFDKEGQTMCRTVLSNGLWCMKITECRFQQGKWKKSVTASAEAEWSIPVLEYFMNGMQKCSRKESYMTLQPEVVMRYGMDFWKDKTNIEGKENGTKSGYR